jgi:hypothetical protein
MAALADKTSSAAGNAAGPACVAPSGDCHAGAGIAPAADGVSCARYPDSLLALRQERVYCLDDFDISPKPLGQGKFGE